MGVANLGCSEYLSEGYGSNPRCYNGYPDSGFLRVSSVFLDKFRSNRFK
jgi:hypothetical protein